MADILAFYDGRAEARARESTRCYHALARTIYQQIVPEGLAVLEIGCGLGDLLAAVNPLAGVGIDISPRTIRIAAGRHPHLEFHAMDVLEWLRQWKASEDRPLFDYILASDLVNELEDVQTLLEELLHFAHPRTRLVLSFFNNLWRPILASAEMIGSKAPLPPQNWLSMPDMKNLLYLSGWELIRTESKILWPLRTPILGTILNRYCAPLFPAICLTQIAIARPAPFMQKQFQPNDSNGERTHEATGILA